MLDLPISNGFFCLIVDTFNAHEIWEEIFGHGKFKKISKISESEVPNISAIDLFDESLRKYICNIFEESFCNEESICDKKIDVSVCEFNSHEISSIKSILDTW